MRRNFTAPFALALGLAGGLLATLAIGPERAWTDDDKDEDDEVHELMEKVHEGKNSPWKRSQRALKQEPVDWVAIDAALPRFSAMSKALANSRNTEVRDAADGYVESVEQLVEQAKKKDAAGARKALASLGGSCGDCHYKGGPGGKLED